LGAFRLYGISAKLNPVFHLGGHFDGNFDLASAFLDQVFDVRFADGCRHARIDSVMPGVC